LNDNNEPRVAPESTVTGPYNLPIRGDEKSVATTEPDATLNPALKTPDDFRSIVNGPRTLNVPAPEIVAPESVNVLALPG